MLFTLSDGKNVEVIGYDEYLKDFEEHVMPELKNNAESILLEALEAEFEDYDDEALNYGFEFVADSPYYTRRGYSFLFFHEEKGEDGRYVVKSSAVYR